MTQVKKTKYGINAGCLPDVDELDALDLILDAGFDAVFSDEYDVKKVAAIKEKSDKLGLSLEFLHAPFHGVNNFWIEGDAYLPLWNNIKSSIDAAENAGIPIIVAHVSSGWFPPQIGDVGLFRFDELVSYAGSHGVTVAFENLRKVGNLTALMDRYEKEPNVGFCYDCGHEHCYTPPVRYTDLFPGRILCTHIHDNFGRDKNDPYADPDIHLMPFDGDLDYADMMTRLRATGYTGTLTLEIFKAGQYAETPAREFLATGRKRIEKIDSLGACASRAPRCSAVLRK